jgi:uncharacterized protein (TIGR02217 family)
MSGIAAFHEVSFPIGLALGASGGPERRTEVVTLASGHEVRNARWADSRRRYDAGSGVKSLDDLHAVIAFFEERRGRLTGFRFRDRADCASCPPERTPAATDQPIGEGALRVFALAKSYGAAFAVWRRTIEKPVAGSVMVAVDGEVLDPDDFSLDTATGIVTLAPSVTPQPGATVTAGFLFDVPVRFDTDSLVLDLSAFAAGEIPSIPLVEIRP